MMPPRFLWSWLFFLGGAGLAVFITGRHDVAALAAGAAGAGLGLLIGQPTTRPGWWPVVWSLLLLLTTALSLLPVADNLLPGWRAGAPDTVLLASSWAAMPAHAFFWWLVLLGTVSGALFLLTSPLDKPSLKIFLYAVAGLVAVYAAVSIVQSQTAWTYPFSGNANFGLLPNRNHTATLLAVGAVISFGLMQCEAERSRLGAAFAALCGAPPLAALLFFSTSRAGILLLVVGFALWAAGAAGTALKRRTALVGAGVLTGFLLLLLVFGGSTVRDRLADLWGEVIAMESVEGMSRDVDFRQPIFRDTLSMIAEAPLTGQGLGHFQFVFPHYREASVRAARVLHPESDWLMVAAESGVPAVVIMLGLAGWYFVRCWRTRQDEGGLLRWTVASAIGAALAHGMIDVPWHRPALGWFLLVVALAGVPPTGGLLQRRRVWRGAQVGAGLMLLAAGAYLGWSGTTPRPPLAYRWEAYMSELKDLAAAQRPDDGELVAREAVRDFPLSYQAYYWRAGFLRVFAGTESEMQDAVKAGRFAEPVLPVVAAEQAQLWVDIDEGLEAEAAVEAMRRAGVIDKTMGGSGSAAGEFEKAMRAAKQRPGVQVALREQLAGDPAMMALWLRLAGAELADSFLSGSGAQIPLLLDGLPIDQRLAVLQRWITLPSAAGAVAYMEGRSLPAPGAYGRTLANFYAKKGGTERAVRLVAQAEGISLEERPVGGEFAGQLVGLQVQGNEVAVRRLLREAVEAKVPDREGLSVAVSWYAAAGDWEMAWRAASRLASTRKNGQ
jgi:O-antigen ligase